MTKTVTSFTGLNRMVIGNEGGFIERQASDVTKRDGSESKVNRRPPEGVWETLSIFEESFTKNTLT